MKYFVVYTTDNASSIVLRDRLANGEVKETKEAFGLGIGNRDISKRDPLQLMFLIVSLDGTFGNFNLVFQFLVHKIIPEEP